MDALLEQIRNGIIPLPMGDIRLDPSQIRVYREADLCRSIERIYGFNYLLADLPTLPSDALHQLRARLLAELRPPKPSKRQRRGG
jgi:hypothetical protein